MGRTLRRFATLAALAILGVCCVCAFGALSTLRRRLPFCGNTVTDERPDEIPKSLFASPKEDKIESTRARSYAAQQELLRKKDPSAFANPMWSVEPKAEDQVETNDDYYGLKLFATHLLRSDS